jgi:hypothetical protein
VGPVATTAADGRFNVTIGVPDDVYGRRTFLIAYAPGSGVDWINFQKEKLPEEVVLRLVKDVPIVGRVVNTEGKPIAGVAVSANATLVPRDENLDGFLAWYLRDIRDSISSQLKVLFVPLDGITGTVTTDKDGRFTLHGGGAERIVHVTFAGGGVARSTQYVITRPGFDPKLYNDALLKEHKAFPHKSTPGPLSAVPYLRRRG